MSIEAMGRKSTQAWTAVLRRTTRIGVSVGLACGVVLLCAGLASAQQTEPLGMLTASQGEVSISRPEPPPGRVVKVRAGAMEQLFAGDVVKTGLNAKAKLLLSDESLITLGEGSELEVTKALFEPAVGRRSTTVRLLHGLARSVVPPIAPHPESRFTVETPTAVLGVRGSELIVQVNAETLAICAEGACDAQNADPAIRVVVNMKSGQYSIIRPGEPPTDPSPVSPALLERLRRLTTLIQEASLMKRDSGPPVPPQYRRLTAEKFGLLPAEFAQILRTLRKEADRRANPPAPHQSLIEMGPPFHQDPSTIPEGPCVLTKGDILVCP
jgi:hypothetical protein